jgi:predicted alpha/beta superfamily hydrolase/Flp pilus assembly protein TadD
MRMPMVYLLVVFISLTSSQPGRTSCFAQEDGEDIVIGKYEVLHSRIMKEDRLLFVHLPREYADTDLKYPVLYLLYVDLYNYFADAATITEKLGTTGETPPLIIIGVANTNRYRDLLPVGIGERGQADRFLKFLRKELIPHVDRTYRTQDFRILAGPQAGAIFSLYALIEDPQLFQAVIAENPFKNPENAPPLLRKAEDYFKEKTSLRGFLYIHCEKDERAEDLKYARQLAGLIESAKPAEFRFTMKLAEPAGYFIAPFPFADALRALFISYQPPDGFQAKSLDDITAYYDERSAEYGLDLVPPARFLTWQGDALKRQGKLQEAGAIFEHQLSLYPKSLDGLWQLGELSRQTGDLTRARKCYTTLLGIRDRDVSMVKDHLADVETRIAGSAAYQVEQTIAGDGMEAGLQLYRKLKDRRNGRLSFDENEFNALGYRLLAGGKPDEAVEIFKLNVRMFPNSANAYDSLAEAYMTNGDTEKAIQNYKKSIELNPRNTNAKRILRKLESN